MIALASPSLRPPLPLRPEGRDAATGPHERESQRTTDPGAVITSRCTHTHVRLRQVLSVRHRPFSGVNVVTWTVTCVRREMQSVLTTQADGTVRWRSTYTARLIRHCICLEAPAAVSPPPSATPPLLRPIDPDTLLHADPTRLADTTYERVLYTLSRLGYAYTRFRTRFEHSRRESLAVDLPQKTPDPPADDSS